MFAMVLERKEEEKSEKINKNYSVTLDVPFFFYILTVPARPTD